MGGRCAGRVQNAPRHRLSVTSVSSPNGVIQRCYHTKEKSFADSCVYPVLAIAD